MYTLDFVLHASLLGIYVLLKSFVFVGVYAYARALRLLMLIQPPPLPTSSSNAQAKINELCFHTKNRFIINCIKTENRLNPPTYAPTIRKAIAITRANQPPFLE
uniref:Uncharacterized protein n=1 Tax=Glossina austeni TaxID=7395 RepID=A0A1A9UT73_GLOAU